MEDNNEIKNSEEIINSVEATAQTEIVTDMTTPDTPVNRSKWEGIKNRFSGLISGIISVFKDKPVTMLLIILLSIVFSIMVDYDYHNDDLEIFLERSVAFLGLFSVQTLFVEEIFGKKLIPRIIGTVAGGGIAGVMTYILSFREEIIWGMDKDIVVEYIGLFLIVYIGVIVLLSVYHMYTASKLKFEKYCIDTFCSLVRATVVYALFAGGIAFIIFIFNELIFDTDYFLARVEIFMAAGIYVPSILLALSREKESYGKFAKLVMLYVLEPMIMLAYLIIYLYIFKILISGEMPSNTVFPILASVFSIAMPIWTMEMGIEEENNIFVKIAKLIPLVFIPFIILQIVCIALRISQYGFTSERYFALSLVVFEIIYMALYSVQYFTKKPLVRFSFIAVAGMLVFMFWIPGTNMIDTVFASQTARIDKIGISRGNDNKEKHNLYTAYRSIKEVSVLAKEKLEKKYTKGDLTLLDEYSDYWWYDEDTDDDKERPCDFYSSNYNISQLEIKGFSVMTRVYSSNYDVEMKTKDFEETVFTMDYYDNNKDNQLYILDISEIMNEAMAYDNSYKFLEENNMFDVGDNRKLYITNLSIGYYRSSKTINRMSIEGYLFE